MHKLIVIIIVSIFFGKRTYLTIINYIFTVQVHELIIPYGTSTILNYFIVEKQTSQKNTELVDVKIIRYYTKEIIHLRNAQFSLIKKTHNVILQNVILPPLICLILTYIISLT